MAYVNAERLGPRKSYSHSEVLSLVAPNSAHAGNMHLTTFQAHQDKLLPEDDPRCADSSSRRLISVVNHWLQDVTPGAQLELETVQDADAIIAGFFVWPTR